jgi:protein-L-isoaspartate(D-aspartate) O-methyltransferase
MSWEHLLSEGDFRLYRENIGLLEERVSADLGALLAEAPDPAILAAIRRVPRHLFVAPAYRALAYTDNALPTSGGLTTSAPSVIALMLHEARVARGSRTLEVGTGTGYEASVLAEMGASVRSIEVDGGLARAANGVLVSLGYKMPTGTQGVGRRASDPAGLERFRAARRLFPGRGEVRLYRGDGSAGCPEGAPYDAIVVAASVPDAAALGDLAMQLSPRGARLVAPVGARNDQELVVIERRGERLRRWAVEGVSLHFVRMVLPGRENGSAR